MHSNLSTQSVGYLIEAPKLRRGDFRHLWPDAVVHTFYLYASFPHPTSRSDTTTQTQTRSFGQGGATRDIRNVDFDVMQDGEVLECTIFILMAPPRLCLHPLPLSSGVRLGEEYARTPSGPRSGRCANDQSFSKREARVPSLRLPPST